MGHRLCSSAFAAPDVNDYALSTHRRTTSKAQTRSGSTQQALHNTAAKPRTEIAKHYGRVGYCKGIKVLIICMLLLFLSNCASVPRNEKYIKNGKEYGVINEVFKGEWYQYYKRGISFAEGEFWKEALRHLKKAMTLTHRDRDKRNATTYGMHTIDYFPHRELGVIFYYQKKYGESIEQLELSREQADSARARHYLSKSRAAFVAASGIDKEKPRITFTSHKSGAQTSSFLIRLTGKVTDDTFVKTIRISGKPFYLATAEQSVTFEKYIRLSTGQNKITIEATDVAGKTEKRDFLVKVDASGPAVRFTRPKNAAAPKGAEIIVEGTAFDVNGVQSVRINDEVVGILKGKRVKFSHRLTLERGQRAVKYAIEDFLGNVTSGQIEMPVKQKKTGKKSNPQTIKFASAERLSAQQLQTIAERYAVAVPIASRSGSSQHAPSTTTHLLTARLRASVMSPTPRIFEGGSFHGEFQGTDGEHRDPGIVYTAQATNRSAKLTTNTAAAPTINITSKIPEKAWPQLPVQEFPFQAKISADTGLRSLKINDKPYENFQEGETELTFDYRIPLSLGDNELKIVAVDRTTEETVKTWPLHRESPSSSKYCLMLCVEFEGDSGSDIAEKLDDAITSGERFKAAMKGSEKFDATVKVEARFYEERRQLGVSVEVIEPESGEKLFKIKGPDYTEDTSEGGVKELCGQIYGELESRFPLISGKLVAVEKDSVVVDWGNVWGGLFEALRTNYKIVIFRYVDDMPSYVAQGLIEYIVQQKTRAILEPGSNRSAELSDMVITK